MSWIRFTVCLWLLRKAVKAAGWLLLALLAVALWPVTVVTAAGYAAAWLRGWPAARLRRAAAASLLVTAVWLIAAAVRQRGLQAAALAPARAWAHGWHHLAALAVARVFLLAGPGRHPGRAGAGVPAVGVADLRAVRRDRRADGLRAGHLRRPPVAAPGPRRPGQDRRARVRPAPGPGRPHPGRRHHPRGRRAGGGRCSPSRPPRAGGTW